MKSSILAEALLIISLLMLWNSTCFANPTIFKDAKAFQHDGRFDDAIGAYKRYLSMPVDGDELSGNKLVMYTDALVQLMNTYQSKGEPEACITALQEVYDSSPILQDQCLRDFYSVMAYALSRTEDMNKAETTMLKALALPLNNATPERYFRDYAYAAAVFYSNPIYQKEVVEWCQEALVQAQLCKNTSGHQWVMSMLGSLYKRDGNLSKALEMFQQSKCDAESRGDNLGVINSLNSLVDLFLYWDIPEYANIYATEAIEFENKVTTKNPMVSAQVYINKGRALHQLGLTDSVSLYTDKARILCESLPYNSGMVDINLLNGICLTEKGGDSLDSGIQELQKVTTSGTAVNRAKAYHRLAQTYLKHDQGRQAETMLDSLFTLMSLNESTGYIHLDFEPIIHHYTQAGNHDKVKQYVELMLREQKAFKERSINFNLVESVVELQTGNRLQDLKIIQLKQANQRLWMLIYIVISLIVVSGIAALLLYKMRTYKIKMKHADEQVETLIRKLKQSNFEKEKIAQEIKEFLAEKDNRQELETLTPFMLKESETKFRQCFELLYPLFVPRLRERVPSISRREELLSMLIALNQDNREIAELFAIAPRSVLMLRHRFRQKIGIASELSLENFIKELLID